MGYKNLLYSTRYYDISVVLNQINKQYHIPYNVTWIIPLLTINSEDSYLCMAKTNIGNENK